MAALYRSGHVRAGFPYVKRVDREQIKNNPELRNADRDNVLNACEGSRIIRPVS